jgi:hypothetical protein
MGTIATVKSSERVNDAGVIGVNLQVEVGQDDEQTVELAQPPGVDSLPLAGDEVILQDSAGSGNEAAVGFVDPKNTGKAEPGEHRTYARDALGNVVAEIWARGSGDIEITSLKAGGKIKLGKVEIDEDGNILTPGDVTAMAKTPVAVTLSTHMHATAANGPPSPPTPGT